MRAVALLVRAFRGAPTTESARSRLCAAALLVGLAASVACGGEATPTTSQVPANFPTAAVRVWLEGLESGDLAEIGRVVEMRSVSVVVALENDFDAEQLAAAATGGLPDDLATQYWRTFKESFEDFQGVRLGALEVGEFTEVETESGTYAFVDVGSPTGAGQVMTRLAANGQWQVDLVGTLAAALGTQFSALPLLSGSEEAHEVLLDVIDDTVLPALEVVAGRPGASPEVEEAIRVLREATDTA